ncbi:hypothetical protein SS37A_42390 (plasmid) [Methylocystis iwaonis]|uniref:Uncharacterized protein n=1 Tax=Methylocystis iwaonis TaxID=2885079 RepID=A0ABN6VME6_9HYPH|nr:hypothetical protein SS37A_42390 [Methylocystis iwaonis]
MPLGRGACAGGDDRLQQVHAAERGGLATGESGSSFDAEAAAIAAHFADRLASLRRRLRRWEIPAAVRAAHEDRAAAMQALRERCERDRHAEREEARRQAEAGALEKPQPS